MLPSGTLKHPWNKFLMKPWAIKLKVLNSILRKVNSDLVRAEIKVIDFLNLRLHNGDILIRVAPEGSFQLK